MDGWTDGRMYVKTRRYKVKGKETAIQKVENKPTGDEPKKEKQKMVEIVGMVGGMPKYNN